MKINRNFENRLFADLKKISEELKQELQDEHVLLFSYEDFYQQLKKDVQNEDSSHKFCVNRITRN